MSRSFEAAMPRARNQLQAELDELRDEVIYLKVKLRKERSLARTEYADVRDRIENLRDARARRRRGLRDAVGTRPRARRRRRRATTTPTTTAPATTTARRNVEIPDRDGDGCAAVEHAEFGNGAGRGSVRSAPRSSISTVDGRTLDPAGFGDARRGHGRRAGDAHEPHGRMTVSFDQLTVNGRAYPMRGTVTQAIEGEGIKGEAGRIGAGAGVGAIIGGILGGFKGALAGILIGGGGTIAATEGKEVELPQGSVLRVRIDSPVQIKTGASDVSTKFTKGSTDSSEGFMPFELVEPLVV